MTVLTTLLALVPAFGLGFQAICMQKIGGEFTNKAVGMYVTVFILGIIAFWLRKPMLSTNLLLGSALSGLGQGIGSFLQIKSYDLLGVSRTMPISTGEQLVGSAFVGALFLHEWHSSIQWFLGILAVILTITGIICTAYHDKNKHDQDGHQYLSKKQMYHGMALLLISSLAFVAYATLPPIFHLNGWDVLLPQSASLLATVLFLTLLSGKRKTIFQQKTLQNMLTGIFFEIANVGLLISNMINGVTISFTFSQLNVVVSTIGGICLLHEYKTKKELKYALAGLLLVVIGAILIGQTKN